MIRKITVIDDYDNIVFHNRITSLPLNEEKIILKSIELFSDSEPCVIHRSYAMKKIYLELEQAIAEACLQGNACELWDKVKNTIAELAFHDVGVKDILVE
jgi:hypothetical protein